MARNLLKTVKFAQLPAKLQGALKDADLTDIAEIAYGDITVSFTITVAVCSGAFEILMDRLGGGNGLVMRPVMADGGVGCSPIPGIRVTLTHGC